MSAGNGNGHGGRIIDLNDRRKYVTREDAVGIATQIAIKMGQEVYAQVAQQHAAKMTELEANMEASLAAAEARWEAKLRRLVTVTQTQVPHA